jgi:4-amino-4-deoxy-L-arabinose transferase-like glycosyltransferase
MNHPACLFLLLITLNLLLAASTRPAHPFPWLYLIAGFFYGWACITRPFTAVAFLPALLLWSGAGQRSFSDNCIRGSLFALAMLPALAFYFTYNAHTTGHPLLSGYEQLFGQNPLGFGSKPWGENPMSTLHVPRQINYTPLVGLANINLHLVSMHLHLFGFPVSSLSLAFLLFLPGMHRSRNDWTCVLLTASVLFMYFFYFFQDDCFGPRFLYETAPFLVLLSARGIRETIRFLIRFCGFNERQSRGLVYTVVTALFLISFSTYWVLRLQQMSDSYWDTPEEVAVLLEQSIPEKNAVIIVEDQNDYRVAFCYLDPLLQQGWISILDYGWQKNYRVLERYPDFPVYLLRMKEVEHPPYFVRELVKLESAEPFQAD